VGRTESTGKEYSRRLLARTPNRRKKREESGQKGKISHAYEGDLDLMIALSRKKEEARKKKVKEAEKRISSRRRQDLEKLPFGGREESAD